MFNWYYNSCVYACVFVDTIRHYKWGLEFSTPTLYIFRASGTVWMLKIVHEDSHVLYFLNSWMEHDSEIFKFRMPRWFPYCVILGLATFHDSYSVISVLIIRGKYLKLVNIRLYCQYFHNCEKVQFLSSLNELSQLRLTVFTLFCSCLSFVRFNSYSCLVVLSALIYYCIMWCLCVMC